VQGLSPFDRGTAFLASFGLLLSEGREADDDAESAYLGIATNGSEGEGTPLHAQLMSFFWARNWTRQGLDRVVEIIWD